MLAEGMKKSRKPQAPMKKENDATDRKGFGRRHIFFPTVKCTVRSRGRGA